MGLDVSDVEPATPPNPCPRDGCDRRFWFRGSVNIHLATEHEIPESFLDLTDA